MKGRIINIPSGDIKMSTMANLLKISQEWKKESTVMRFGKHPNSCSYNVVCLVPYSPSSEF